MSKIGVRHIGVSKCHLMILSITKLHSESYIDSVYLGNQWPFGEEDLEHRDFPADSKFQTKRSIDISSKFKIFK